MLLLLFFVALVYVMVKVAGNSSKKVEEPKKVEEIIEVEEPKKVEEPIIPIEENPQVSLDVLDSDKSLGFTPDGSKVVYIDVETTGLFPDRDDLLQLAVVGYNGEELYNGYFKPVRKTSWKSAMKINGITPEMVKDSPSFQSELKKIQAIISNSTYVLGYNVSFDRRFLEANGVDFSNVTFVDVMRTTACYVKFENKKLVTVAKGLGYDFKNAHNALSDVMATKFVFDTVNTWERRNILDFLTKDYCIRTYGKYKFQYKKIRYDATKDWDKFIEGCTLKINEKGFI